MQPTLRSISKMDIDRKMAVDLFNRIYDFTLGFVLKYLRQKDYEECNKNFPNPFVDLSAELKSRTFNKQ